mgnify:CR=1 FL=1
MPRVIRHGADHTIGFAGRARERDGTARMRAARLLDQQRQIPLQVPALRQKDRHHCDAIGAAGNPARIIRTIEAT